MRARRVVRETEDEKAQPLRLLTERRGRLASWDGMQRQVEAGRSKTVGMLQV